MRQIFCDEAGYTGNRLWEEEQPFFTYAAVEVESAEATWAVERLRRERRIDTAELKGGTLCRKPRGQALVRQVIEEFGDRASVVVIQKKYALACKMFEYLFEPVLCDFSSILYDLNFHKFIANGLYAHMATGDENARIAFVRFQEALRERTSSKLLAVESAFCDQFSLDGFVDQVLTFVTCNRDKISDEVVTDLRTASSHWMLELTTNALRAVLTTLGHDMEPLEVSCDQSKPLAAQPELFDAMIGRTDKQMIWFAGKEHQLTYNLSREIELVDSASTPGIQLADVMASAAAYAMKNPTSELSAFWRDNCHRFIHGESMMPELDQFDLNQSEACLNALILQELIDRAVRGVSYSAGICEYIQTAQAMVAQGALEDADQRAD